MTATTLGFTKPWHFSAHPRRATWSRLAFGRQPLQVLPTMVLGQWHAFKRNDQHRGRRKGKHYFNNSLTGKKISLSTIALVDDDLSIDRI
jgi:hypothetical protein